MLKNKAFARYAIAFCVLGVIWNFFYSGLQNDQINIIQASSAWNANATMLPMTIGSLICIVLTMIYGTLFIKFGVRKVLMPCVLLCALGCVGIVVANGVQVSTPDGVMTFLNASTAGYDTSTLPILGNYGLYFISLLVMRCGCMCFQMAGFQMAASWFIRYRGRALGIITLGSPLFSVVGTTGMTTLIATYWNGDYRPFYVGVCVLLIIVAILSWLLLRDYPEDVGLYPDGSDTAPKSERDDSVHLTVKQVLTKAKSWMLIVNFGAFQFIIVAAMASMVTWFMYLCNANWDVVAAANSADPRFGVMGPMYLFLAQAAKWLSVGAILGIPMSFIFGVIDDKLGTPVACMLMGATELLVVIGLWSQAGAVASTGSCSIPMLVMWGFGVACMTGGVPTMHPASLSFVFGRREYQSANRVIMAIQMIPGAVAATIMMALINSGNGNIAWGMCTAIIVIGLIATIPMFKMKDANAEDRDHA